MIIDKVNKLLCLKPGSRCKMCARNLDDGYIKNFIRFEIKKEEKWGKTFKFYAVFSCGEGNFNVNFIIGRKAIFHEIINFSLN